MAAIRLNNAHNVHLHNVTTSGFNVGVDATGSSGLVTGYNGSPLHFSQGSDFQVVNSHTSGLAADASSRVEIINSIATELIHFSQGKQDPVINDLRYYSHCVLKANSGREKQDLIKQMKDKVLEAEQYLRLIGYFKPIIDILWNNLGL